MHARGRTRDVRPRGAAWITAAALLWGTLGPIAALAMRLGAAPVEVAFYRLAVSALLFVAAAGRGDALRLTRTGVGPVLVFGVGCMATLFVAYFASMRTLGVARAVLLLYLAPALTVVLRAAMARRLPRGATLVAATLGCAGVAVASLGGTSAAQPVVSTTGIVLGLLAAGALAVYPLAAGATIRAAGAPAGFAWAMAAGAGSLLPLLHPRAHAPLVWVLFAIAGVVPGYLASWCYARGLPHVPAERAAILGTIEPIASIAIAALVLGERAGLATVLGASCCIAAAVLSSPHVTIEPETLP